MIKNMITSKQIIDIVITGDLSTVKTRVGVLQRVVRSCNEALKKDIEGVKTVGFIVASARQVCNAWDDAAHDLRNNGKLLIKEGGYKFYLQRNKELKQVLDQIGFK
jgi:hypothetical protein